MRLNWLESAHLRSILQQAILTRKVGQTGLVFGVRSGFFSRSVRARLQVSVQRLRFVWPWLIPRHTHRQHFDQFISTARPAELEVINLKVFRWHYSHVVSCCVSGMVCFQQRSECWMLRNMNSVNNDSTSVRITRVLEFSRLDSKVLCLHSQYQMNWWSIVCLKWSLFFSKANSTSTRYFIFIFIWIRHQFGTE